MTRTVDDMSLVDHACVVPDSEEHLWEVTADWLAGGLAAGERVVYFEDDTAERLLGRLADDRVPVRSALAAGQLVIVPTQQTHTELTAPTEQLVRFIGGQMAEAEADGWSGLRLAGESTPALMQAGGVPKVAAYEAAVDRAIHDHPSARLLCRYDRHTFDDTLLAQMRAIHHTELLTSAVYDDTLLRITAVGPVAARLAGEVDHSNRPRIRSLIDTSLDQALRSHSAPTDITLDLASLRFLDVAGAVSLVHAAEEFPSTHRLVLTEVRPGIVRVLDRCGSPFAAQLVVIARGAEGTT